MKSIRGIIVERVSEALVAVLGAEGAEADPMVTPSQDSKRGDYQSNCAMGLAKKLGRKPRELAEQIVAGLKIDDICEPPEIAGPGFINFRLKNEFLAASLGERVKLKYEVQRTKYEKRAMVPRFVRSATLSLTRRWRAGL